MMRYLFSFFLFISFFLETTAQRPYKITGFFPTAVKKEVLLKAFGFKKDSVLAKINTDATGRFTIKYPASYTGAAVLEITGLKSVIVLLNKENFGVQWSDLEDFKTLTFTNSPENDAFAEGIALYQNAEGKRSGLDYLLPLYVKDNIRSGFITQEIKVQKQAMDLYLGGLPKDSYAIYYLKIRRLIADMPQTAERYIERISEHEISFNTLDFNDKRLIQSGLYEELLNTYVVLMESYGGQVYAHMDASSDALIKSLKINPDLQQEVATTLFNFFEKRSLFKSAEHIALTMLEDDGCRLDANNQALFEQYRKMAKGNLAPKLKFENTKSSFKELGDLKNKYKLVIFASSWCTNCIEEIPKIKAFYPGWKKKDDLEVVLVSLDTDKEKYEAFIKDMDWVTTSDFEGWEGQAARDYCIFATPTLYLLDADNKILVKPVSPEQINAWLDMLRTKELQ